MRKSLLLKTILTSLVRQLEVTVHPPNSLDAQQQTQEVHQIIAPVGTTPV